MRFVTPLSLALALALTGGAVSAPASAAKKEEKPAAAS
ncbi:Putative negative regulator of RcsB-dependent stress response OS=Sphingobium scionense OX=1404341 GN=GGQ90_000722 PE=4 SV=1 [Sphingobium scionense]